MTIGRQHTQIISGGLRFEFNKSIDLVAFCPHEEKAESSVLLLRRRGDPISAKRSLVIRVGLYVEFMKLTS